jgi:hypothetical protein
MLISQYYGVPSNYCELQATTLQETKFNIRTALGDSIKMYQHSNETPIHGTGQGSCSSLEIWILISSFLMDLLQDNATGMTMDDVEKTTNQIRQWIEGFVDDTSLFTNLIFGENNIKKSKDKAEHDGQIWERLLNVTGGELELKKGFFYVFSWKWDKYGNPSPQYIKEQHIEQIEIKLSTTNEIKVLEQKEVSTSHKTLGTYKCIYGEEKEQFRILSDKSNQISEQLNRKQSWLAYKCFYIPAMTYSLTAVSITEQQLTKIQQKATTNFTRACGYEMTLPKAVTHGSIAYGGLGFHQLYVESNIEK